MEHADRLITKLLTTTARKWWDDNPWRLSAALSYYTLFSLAPLLTLAVAGAAMVVDEAVVQEELLRQLQELIGGKGANALTPMLHSARHPVHGILATLISLITLFIVSMGMFSELQDALNFIWRIPGHRRSSALWGLLRTRLFSFLLVIGTGLLLFTALVLNIVMVAVAKFIHKEMPEPQVIIDRDQYHGISGGHGRTVHIDVQNPAGRAYRLAGCLDWSNRHCRSVYIGKVGNRAVSGRAGADLNVRSRLFTDGDLGVGLLLRVDFLPRCPEFTYVYAHQFGSQRPATRSQAVNMEAE
jgi:hypothetical protein